MSSRGSFSIVRYFWHRRRRPQFLGILGLAGICLYLCLQRDPITLNGIAQEARLRIYGERPLPKPSQQLINFMAKYVNLNFTVLNNYYSSSTDHIPQFLSTISLTNTGSDVIPPTSWHMYGYIFMLVEPMYHPYPDGHVITSCGLKVFHIDGNLYRFQPVGNLFPDLIPGYPVKCYVHIRNFQISKTDSMPNWFFTAPNLNPGIIQNTADETLKFVSDFVNKHQYTSHRHKAKPYTPDFRCDAFKREVIDSSPLHIIPTPLSVISDSSSIFKINPYKFKILQFEEFANEVQYLSANTKIRVGRIQPQNNYIIFKKSAIDISKEIPNLQGATQYVTSEAYIIESKPLEYVMEITADTPRGAFYAVQTLISILKSEEHTLDVDIPKFRILDAPRYSYRGLHVDVARNFFGPPEMMKVIDALAMYKMNKLHLHLSDDEGWRLEIPGVPELTQIGGRRCFDPTGDECIMPFYGSGPFANTSGSGYYTVDDYKAILQHAVKRHVTIIPEFDMPGHSSAAIKAIHAPTPQLRRAQSNSITYNLLDSHDTSEYASGQNYKNNAMNPCIKSTYDFVRKIMRSVKEMHNDIQPLVFYHFGGDEVAQGAWVDSEVCNNMSKIYPELSTLYGRMQYFINRVATIAKEEGLSLGAWEDAALSHDQEKGIPFPRTAFPNNDMYVYVWKRPVEGRTPHRAKLFANSGYKVVLAYGSYLYFDHPYEPDPEERGLYWATRKISNYDAWSFSENIVNRDDQLECPPEITNKDSCYTLEKPENIVGIQAELWTETVRTDEQLEYMLFPRLLGVAERAWHKASWEGHSSGRKWERIKERDWSMFAAAVGYRELPRLDDMGIRYRVSPPCAKMLNDRVVFRPEFPGLDIEYWSTRSKDWLTVTQNMPIIEPLKLRTRSSDGKRFSREIIFYPD